MDEKVGIRGKFAEQKIEMETDGAWEGNPPEEGERSRVKDLCHSHWEGLCAVVLTAVENEHSLISCIWLPHM